MPEGLTPIADLVRVSGPAATAIRSVLAYAWVAPDFDTARAAARVCPERSLPSTATSSAAPTSSRRRPRRSQGHPDDQVGDQELRERAEHQGAAVERVREELSAIDLRIAAAESATLSLQGEQHRQEKSMVGFDLQIGAAGEAAERIARKREQIAVERRTAEEEQRTQDARQEEAKQSIARIEFDQREADDQLNRAQRRLFDAREPCRRSPTGPPRRRRRTRRWSNGPARCRSRFAGSRTPAPSSRRGWRRGGTICARRVSPQ